ncbi:MAG TPA: hypothetical protein ENJ18_02390 [Nannocystis exedens]|nr:hypothetical protein [Nannocystis exedens]
MIDYDVLCQAIGDWKAGRAPTPVSHDAGPPRPPVHQAEELEDIGDLDNEFEDLELQEEAPEPQDQTMIYQLPIEPLDEDDL